MRKIILFYFLQLIVGRLASQDVHISRHTSVDRVTNLVSINTRAFYAERTHLYGSDSCNLVAINENGAIIFKKNFSLGIYNTIIQLIETKDKALALIGYSDQCDVGGNEKNFFTKMDTSGNVQFQTFVPNVYGFDFLRSVTQFIDSSYYIVNDSMLYHYSKNGQFISEINTGITNISVVSSLNNGNLLINGLVNSIRKNIELTPTASIIAQQGPASAVGKYLQKPDNFIFALCSNGSVEKLNPNLSVAVSTTLTLNPNVIITAFTTRNDSVFATGYTTPAKMPLYMVLDYNLSVLYQSPSSSYKNVHPSGITFLKNKVNIITNSTSSLMTNISFNSFFQFPITGSFNSSPDVGVTDFVMTASVFNPPSSGASYNFNVTVKNFTTDTIKSFYLNCNYFPWYCGSTQFHKLYYSTIIPNSTISIQTGTFYSRPFSSDICFFTTVPNFRNDSEISNDGYCTIPVPLYENSPDVENIKVFPNPFTSNIHISSTVGIGTIKVYNSLGLLVRKSDVWDTTIELNTADLPDGVYILKCETTTEGYVKKIIKN